MPRWMKKLIIPVVGVVANTLRRVGFAVEAWADKKLIENEERKHKK